MSFGLEKKQRSYSSYFSLSLALIYIGRFHRRFRASLKPSAHARPSGIAVLEKGGELRTRAIEMQAHTLSKTFARAIRITPASSLLLEQLHFLLPDVCPRKRERERESTRSRTGKLWLKRAPLTGAFIIPNVQLSPSPPLLLRAAMLRTSIGVG